MLLSFEYIKYITYSVPMQTFNYWGTPSLIVKNGLLSSTLAVSYPYSLSGAY